MSTLHNMIRVEFANVNRRLTDTETRGDKLAARCDRIPTLSSDITAYRRELAEVREDISQQMLDFKKFCVSGLKLKSP